MTCRANTFLGRSGVWSWEERYRRVEERRSAHHPASGWLQAVIRLQEGILGAGVCGHNMAELKLHFQRQAGAPLMRVSHEMGLAVATVQRRHLEVPRRPGGGTCMKAAAVFEAGSHRWWVLHDQDERIASSIRTSTSWRPNGQSALLDPGGFEIFPQVFSRHGGGSRAFVGKERIRIPPGSGYRF